jgi:hypothetical protein
MSAKKRKSDVTYTLSAASRIVPRSPVPIRICCTFNDFSKFILCEDQDFQRIAHSLASYRELTATPRATCDWVLKGGSWSVEHERNVS